MSNLSIGTRLYDLGSSTIIAWGRAEHFTKSITVNTTFTFLDIQEKHIKFTVTNTSGSDVSVGFNLGGVYSFKNNISDVVLRARPNRSLSFEFVGDPRNNYVYILNPLKTEVIYIP